MERSRLETGQSHDFKEWIREGECMLHTLIQNNKIPVSSRYLEAWIWKATDRTRKEEEKLPFHNCHIIKRVTTRFPIGYK
ncbi:hypothetical protein PNOK_0037600 [Pyrrhoderma noxium]|uniref:Uncharacterized protein n=1 Tax=Pyrrhoderma noxium TaxID=2282107 RepID=A0A286UUQ3_9AGAM|nr:hypothetical protein PNOK_0037600 [Pyrrhoderma noxium]